MVLFIYPCLHLNLFGIDWFSRTFLLSVEPLGALLMLPYASAIKHGRGLLFRFFSFVSLISYSIYLVNFTPFNGHVQPLLHSRLGIAGKDTTVFFFFAWAFGAAYLLYQFVERPFMNMRERLQR